MPDAGRYVRERIINKHLEVETDNQIISDRSDLLNPNIPGFVRPKLDDDVTIGDMRVSLRFDDTIDKETGRPIGLVADIGDRQGVDVWNTYEDDESSKNKAGMEVEFKNKQTTFRNLNGGEERLELSSGSWKLAKNALYIDEKTGKNWYILESKKGDSKILVSTNDFTLPDTE
ncbi:MAG: hypothetical protein LBK68_05175 [Candidatus Margulisbacteria bacterium]|jgi:hypothetical protein|nr:hypothetical protein [Candidatus Margulisiibacteriota bacterium]